MTPVFTGFFCNLAKIHELAQRQRLGIFKKPDKMPEKAASKSRSETVVLGMMSGTSLDGVDLALCAFGEKGSSYSFKILKATTVVYPAIWKQRLTSASGASAEKYVAMDAFYGQYIGDLVNDFLKGSRIKPAAIASHGHTVFHQPHAHFSTQAGNGAVIAAVTGIKTICDFRSLDVALGGQGAPLVPVGDRFLFGKYQACLNLGGIANISYEKKKKRIAYDICVVNMLLNNLADTLGLDYDPAGKNAASGKVNSALLTKLNSLDYYKKAGAKSMGREWFEKNILPLFESSSLNIYDQLATATEHVAEMIARDLDGAGITDVLVSGGGAYNAHLIDLIRSKCKTKVHLPSDEIINFKEALIFAFLGYLRLKGHVNALASVTGANRDSCGGAVYEGK
jgi:anhydro-N-acetylmuramic acid kinase